MYAQYGSMYVPKTEGVILAIVEKKRFSVQEWDESKEVDLVIIKAAGDKAFCAGGDAIGKTFCLPNAKKNRLFYDSGSEFKEKTS